MVQKGPNMAPEWPKHGPSNSTLDVTFLRDLGKNLKHLKQEQVEAMIK